jgi:TRAP-type C4-dicarboxylate transport system permease small subunit
VRPAPEEGEVPSAAARAPAGARSLAARGLQVLNGALVSLSALALLAAAGVLTFSVLSRYLLKLPTEWQDEASVFLMVGATFLCGAYVQSYRGHVGIEALATLLPRRLDRARRLLCDLVSLAFCAFFSWKSWTLLREAVVDHQTTSSSWGPPLSIPYALMAVGMTLVAAQLGLQVAAGLGAREARR